MQVVKCAKGECSFKSSNISLDFTIIKLNIFSESLAKVLDYKLSTCFSKTKFLNMYAQKLFASV